MGARGPKLGSGEVSAWVVAALKLGDKTRAEIRMGSSFSCRQIANVIARMIRLGQIEVVPGYRPGAVNRHCYVYTLVEKNIATTPPTYPAKSRRHDAGYASSRAITDAFLRIVSQRTTSA